ncbi:MAG: DUF5676 family membrane protein [Nitrospinota bacterium]
MTIQRVGTSVGLFLAVSYVLCVVTDLSWPGTFQMYRVWSPLLPGFTWLTWGSFFLGLIESFLYGWYFALVFVPLYRLLGGRREAAAA